MVRLARQNHPRFSPDMLVRTRVIFDATAADLIVRAVSDNEVRKALGQFERIMAAKKLDDARVPVQRAAAALGESVKTYERDRLIGKHPWMFELVRTDCVAPSTASLLLAVAVKEKRMPELETDLKAWVEEIQERVAKKGRLRQLKDGKELRPSERLVKNYMTKPLLEKWVVQLRKKERFDREVPWDFGAGIDADSNKLQIEGITVDLAKEPLDRLAKVAGKLARVQQGVMEYLKSRHAIEAARGPQDLARQDAEVPYDVKVLREAGLHDLADELELQLMEEAEPGQAIAPEENLPPTTEGA
jgi:hypothetical protein